MAKKKTAKKKKKAAKKPEAEPEAEPEAKPEAKKKKTAKKKKAKKKVETDPFLALAARAAKAWPGTVGVASTIASKIMHLPIISTGNIGLDIAMFGGFRRSRIHRFYGREKSCKTGSCLNAMAEWQKHCGECYERGPCKHGTVSGVDRPKAKGCWIDAENRLNGMWEWVQAHGVDLDCLLYQSPPTGQHVVDFTDAVIREKGASVGFIVVDSIANVVSMEELKKPTMKGRTAPMNAQLVNGACRRWTAATNSLGVEELKKPTIALINQIRKTMDQYQPETMPGGVGLDFATSLDVRFAAGKKHYVIPAFDKAGKPKGYEDKVPKFGPQGWKPEPDQVPDYVEINYRVTSSGVCPPGRYGQFQYWMLATHGRRKGDPDNANRLWEYVRRYDLMEKEGRGYKLLDLEGGTQHALKTAFLNDVEAQHRVWDAVVARLLL